MTKFNINILGILILSLIAFAPVVDAGGCCSGGTWDPSAFLNSETETGQPATSGSTQDTNSVDSGSNIKEPIERASIYPNGVILKPMKSVSNSDVVIDVSNGDSYAASHPRTEAAPAPSMPSPSAASADGFMNIPDGIDEELPFN